MAWLQFNFHYYHMFVCTVWSCILMEVKTNLEAPFQDVYLSFVHSNEILQARRKKLWK